jgi:hypothetical protein
VRTRCLEKSDDYIKKVMSDLYIIILLYQKVHNLKTEYLCPGKSWAANILDLEFSRLE